MIQPTLTLTELRRPLRQHENLPISVFTATLPIWLSGEVGAVDVLLFINCSFWTLETQIGMSDQSMVLARAYCGNPRGQNDDTHLRLGDSCGRSHERDFEVKHTRGAIGSFAMRVGFIVRRRFRLPGKWCSNSGPGQPQSPVS